MIRILKLFLIIILFIIVADNTGAAPTNTDNHIKTDQFGYRPADRKVAVISNPVTGYNSNDPFTPGNIYKVKRWNDDVTVYSAAITQWNGGATHSQSGDKVWWFDFTSVSASGSYYIYDSLNNAASYRFEISENIYENALRQTLRTFYYQRCGSSKSLPYAQTGWTDSECHKGALQDTDCRLYNNNNFSTSKNLSGGWHDAGDYNKYVNFTFDAMTDLLLAYKENPEVWTDALNIPESGNGIPDILDEIKYELDWLLKMQNANGSVLSIVGVMNFSSASPPSADNAQRFYGPATASATFTAASIFALAAIQFNSIGQSAYAETLMNAAINGWNWGAANDTAVFYNSGIIGAGEQEVSSYERLVRKLSASVYLYHLTGNTSYKTFFESNYSQMHLLQWGYAYPFECAQQNMLLYYSSLSGISSTVGNSIRNAYRNSMKTNNADNLPAYLNNTDAYRSYISNQNYTWGSNTTKARQGVMFNNMITYKLDTLSNTDYKNAAIGFVNYFHGVNPTAFCYLTNMSAYGAENSINEVYHAWFEDGSALWDKVGTSVYGPAPGFIAGGVNPSYSLDFCCPNGCGGSNSLCSPSLVTPPLGQPIQKSYKDWNSSWPQNSWTITEPGIYTQAAFVHLVSLFISARTSVDMKIIVQGIYSEVEHTLNLRDTVKLILRNQNSPYAVVDYSYSVIDSVTFSGEFYFETVQTGSYFFVIEHRNSLETWSADAESVISGNSVSYDFTNSSDAAFGNNLIHIDTSPDLYAVYSGDVNKDDAVDISDLSLIDNDASIFLTGYIYTDLNGDGLTDISDYLIAENNSFAFIAIIRP
ncbi:MAG: glycoside hydrolase family 9 protein [Ignavibacteria bacterium]|nr:glycoside hydrolase family 9 protein [Ignavibacteria bacterium]